MWYRISNSISRLGQVVCGYGRGYDQVLRASGCSQTAMRRNKQKPTLRHPRARLH